MSGAEEPAETLGAGLRQRVKPYMGRLWLGALLLSITNIVDKAIPWMLKDAVDALAEQRIDDVVRWATYCAITACVMWVVRSASRVVVFNIGRDVEFDLRGELMRHIHALGPAFFGRMGTGEVMSRATNDLAQVRLLIGFGLLNVINSLFAYVGGIGLMMTLSVELTLLSLIPYPFFIIIARWFGKAIYVRSRAAQETLAKLADTAQENLAGVRVVRSFALEDQQMRRFDEVNAEAIERNMALVTIRGLMWPVLLSVGSIATVIAVWRGGEMVLNKELTPGEFTAFIAYLGQLVWPTLALGYLLAVVQRGRASYERVAEILHFTPSITEADGAVAPSGAGELRVESLSFTRGETKALQDISFKVPAGGSLAIVGTTGSGKTTLANLLARLLETPDGAVFLDDVDITQLKLLPLRSAVAVAPQEPFLFSTTVAGNIALALPDPTADDAAERIVHSAREASVHEEILKLVDGYETVVGERGVQLSGGQKQRVALARALLNNPRVLVLDDPLSAVDARTEAAILDALDRVAQERTMVLITNRIAAAARADQVLVLDEGRIVERGTHESLCAGRGLYARLAEKQALERELKAL